MGAFITQYVIPFFGQTDSHRPRILHEYPNRMPLIRAKFVDGLHLPKIYSTNPLKGVKERSIMLVERTLRLYRTEKR